MNKTRRPASPEYDTPIAFHVPPANQGQMIIISYAAAYPYVLRHQHDRSDNSHSYEISRVVSNDEGDYWNGEPPNRRWREMTAEELRNFRLA